MTFSNRMSHFDTIVAPITGPGPAGVAIVRLSGPEAWEIASAVFEPWHPEPFRAQYGRYLHGDDGMALPFAEGHSYTGDQAVELSIHGSSASVRALVDACLGNGARLAEPGEFTQRAFLNGRIDLTQAEAVRDTIEARTSAQLRLANLQREGALSQRIADLRHKVMGVLAAIEASVDFSEEIGELDKPAAISRLRSAQDDIGRLLETAPVARILRNGLRVAIIGPPNAGKSSLLNALLGIERSIVTEVPGTTRDYVEEQIEVDGFPVVLIDTAGLRESEDRVETIGIERTRRIASNADVVWYVFDATQGLPPEFGAVGESTTLIANKCDLAEPSVGIPVSALSGEGLRDLLATLPVDRELGNREIAINSRHADLLEETRKSLETAIGTLESERPVDLATVLLQDALHSLGQITGDTASVDMVTRIFSDFCIGK